MAKKKVTKEQRIRRKFVENIWHGIKVGAPIVAIVTAIIAIIFGPFPVKVITLFGIAVTIFCWWIHNMWQKSKDDVKKENKDIVDLLKKDFSGD